MATEKSVATAKQRQSSGFSRQWRAFLKFLGEVQAELKRATWPSREELISQTKIVLSVLAGLASFIFVMDRILGWVLQIVMGWMGVR